MTTEWRLVKCKPSACISIMKCLLVASACCCVLLYRGSSTFLKNNEILYVGQENSPYKLSKELVNKSTQEIGGELQIVRNSIKTQKERQKHILKTCSLISQDLEYRRPYLDYMSSNGSGVAYCREDKVGTTTFSEMMYNWRRLDSPNLQLLRGKIHRQARQNLRRIYLKQLLKERKRFSVTSFMFVRHPFVRLVSAYRDKVREDRHGFVIRPHDPRSPINHEVDSLQDEKFNELSQTEKEARPTFREFAWDVSRQINSCNKMEKKGKLHCLRSQVNQHYSPLYHRCNPCYFHFDIIGKLETVADDIALLLAKTGLPATSKTKIRNKSTGRLNLTRIGLNNLQSELSKNITTDILREYEHNQQLNSSSALQRETNRVYLSTEEAARLYYSRMTKAELTNFRNAYAIDFKLFSYDPFTYAVDNN